MSYGLPSLRIWQVLAAKTRARHPLLGCIAAMLGLHMCSLSALLPSSARQQQLLMLRDIAQVKQNLAKVQEAVVAGGVADTTSLFASLQQGTKELVATPRVGSKFGCTT